jgi:hypothetical protein
MREGRLLEGAAWIQTPNHAGGSSRLFFGLNYLARLICREVIGRGIAPQQPEASMAFPSSRKEQPVDFLSVAFSIFVVIVIVGWIGYLIFAY